MRLSLCYAALFAALALAPSPARACLLIGELKLDGYPRDGDEGVPLDAVPIYQLTVGELRSQIEVLLPEGGLARPALPSAELSYEGGKVALTVRAARGGYFEIVPAQPLLPRTQYTLVVAYQEREDPRSLLNGGPLIEKHRSLSFRTGAENDASDMAAPALFATQYVGKVGTSCDPPERALCFSLPDDDALYVAQFEGDPLISIERGSFFNNRLYRDDNDQLDCMRIQRRASNGSLSEAAVSCRAERTVYDLEQLPEPDEDDIGLDCESDGLHWGKQLVRERFAQFAQREQADARAEDAPNGEQAEMRTTSADSGCSLASRNRSARAQVALVLLALGLFVRRTQRA